MSHSPRVTANDPIIDDFPLRPDAIKQDERTSNRSNGKHRTLVLFSLIYFLYGSGISIYGPLYPEQARKMGVSSRIYGSVIAYSHFVCILFYPLACHIVSKVSSRNSLSVSVFVIGACRILFGTLSLISKEESFIAISYAVQFVEGIGMSILIACTVVAVGTQEKDQMWKFILALQSFLSLGLVLGPIGGQLVKDLHLNSLYFSMAFSISPFLYGLTIPGWKWLIKKGFNNVMLVFIGNIAIIGSLVLLGPAPFTSLEASLKYVCTALVLEGLGIACKSACVIDASEKDLRYGRKYTETQQKLIVPTIFLLGASLGCFCGSLTAGFTDYYIRYKKATLPLFALEMCTAIGAVVFAMSRNYVSKKRREESEESQPILNS